MFNGFMCIFIVLISFIVLSKSHPQCLDFRPPFEAKHELLFCSEYSDFGCCSQKKDSILAVFYNNILSNLTADNLHQCADMVKDIVCQECSPYAAHIYDSEVTQIKRPFPGLCTNYCHAFYTSCSGAVKYISNETDVLNHLYSRDTFCDFVALNDVDYCYPELLTNEVLNGNISHEARTQEGCLCLEEFATNLRNPLLLRSPPDGSQRLFVAEQIGVVYIYFKDKSRVEKPFLDLTDVVLTSNWRGDERGFLGLAFHPKYLENRRLFVYYSTKISNIHFIRISEFLAKQWDPNSVDPHSEKIILEVEQPYANHNGGEILFGTDGYLYCFLGDGGAGGDPQGNAQDKSVLLGKVLRLDIDSPPDQGLAYKIPDDNPFIHEQGTRPEIYAYGIRNIWRCDVDDGDISNGYGYGRIICGDVGQNAYEEIDIIYKGGNYGWNAREGDECFTDETCGNIGPEVWPIHAYPHAVGKSVTGGHIYRGCMNPNLQGKYIYGDYVNGKLFTLEEDIDTGHWQGKDITMCGDDVCFNGLTNQYHHNILSFGEDDDGEIYMLSTSQPRTENAGGTVYKFVDPRRRGDLTQCRSYNTTYEWPDTTRLADVTQQNSNTASVPYGNNGWKFSWMPVTTCIMVPAWKCYHFFL